MLVILIENIKGFNLLQKTELVFVGLIIAYQIYLLFRLINLVSIFKNIFKILPVVNNINGDVKNEGSVGDYLSITEATNPTFQRILDAINNYLNKNKGATVEFNILKDIVDRNVDIDEEDINNRIPAPLYAGLAATMLGIIFGLFNMDFDINTESSDLINNIEPLIFGVKIAMIASVTGLIITTFFSVFLFKKSKTQMDIGRNDFLGLLQRDLLPRMEQSKLPEVSILSRKLDHFALNTISSIDKLDTVVANSISVIENEKKLIEEIKSLDITKVSSSNLDIFNKLKGMMDSFDKFAIYYTTLNKSLATTDKLLVNLDKFVNATENVNAILESIKNQIVTTEKATNFFNQHIKSFERYQEAINEAIASTDSKMSDAIIKLGESVSNQMDVFNVAVSSYDEKLKLAFENSTKNFTEVLRSQAEQNGILIKNLTEKVTITLEDSYKNQLRTNEKLISNFSDEISNTLKNSLHSFEQFKELNKLDELAIIKNEIQTMNTNIRTSQDEMADFIKNTLDAEKKANTITLKPKKTLLEKINVYVQFVTYILVISICIWFLIKELKA
ncbi:flavin-binding protein dodecin [Wenyingzhuangia heitensis]|uniref:Flavin-binding protein dodecin n=1 Tax=Wenyingzhuangia heitensis TaxID=1487859 RepID=A0ABX0UDA1_9FLAO|nr:hypothetical protein [Wenyingzhuangia heitensis]NIJ45136.1 flavin-binding protein dodecin [Wenyingzhuangia heitensis]